MFVLAAVLLSSTRKIATGQLVGERSPSSQALSESTVRIVFLLQGVPWDPRSTRGLEGASHEDDHRIMFLLLGKARPGSIFAKQ